MRQSLHSKQFTYQAGKSTVSALHHIVGKIENAIKYKEVALAAFIDVEGVFDNTGFDSIETYRPGDCRMDHQARCLSVALSLPG
jgi:hypothetical protein